ncbi:CDC42 small effector protein 2 [Lingula anatina]|uniref:CDC42 small effector protein 2 n=1 Tax=Lingula anatina TaxID=7574 RepID=A0A1S3KBW0_LINAN|nr:CDC42 small effector protein 2 [Lingula anatina]|eukprot:XP_013420115.1 CDC42 small effector protein 2 [Lingula anatina]
MGMHKGVTAPVDEMECSCVESKVKLVKRPPVKLGSSAAHKMSDVLVCFRCCVAEQPQPKRRRRIDRSMIGLPTNFQHTGHIGSGDVSNFSSPGVNSIQGQMSSKGGYDHVSPVSVHLDVRDLQDVQKS